MRNDHHWVDQELIRAEPFSAERFRQHARSLASAQPTLTREQGGTPLGRRLADNEQVLLKAYRAIADAVGSGLTITPAAEWILDNYHIIEEQIFEIRGDLPPGYYRELPKLAEGPLRGLPRVFGIAWAFIAHTDSRFDGDLLCDFVAAYQEVQPLTIAELWALPITLRIVLVENLRRAAERIVQRQKQRVEADAFAERILGSIQRSAEPISQVLRSEPRPLSTTLVVQLAHRLHDPGPIATGALQWLEVNVADDGTPLEAIVQGEHGRQAAMNVTARNVITSMREISAIDWPDIFERVSLVDAALRAETSFAAMDFPTRDLYRRNIEILARRSGKDELTVTQRLIARCAKARARNADERRTDPGYYLIDRGRRSFERALEYRPTAGEMPGRAAARLSPAGFVAIILGAGVLLLALVLALTGGGASTALLAAMAILGFFPAIEIANIVVARLVLATARTSLVPALAIENGIPPDLRTMIVIPTLLSSEAAVDAVVGQIEIHYLANPDEGLTFAILSDWRDASSESLPDDAALLARAAAGIAHLNRLYARGDDSRFLLLHRRRLWNETQQLWIGWERKRGKLEELNRLLRGATDTSFVPIDGTPPAVPDAVRYVITLDSDTQLPPDTAAKLIGKMAHPMNRPEIDHERAIVTNGYGVMQPRVTLSLPHGDEGSLFQLLFSGANGMDPYASPVADVYQDLFGEGSFLGKGIYDVDAFEAVMKGRTPENAILSHDLFEGIFARCGLVGDIEFVEEFPRRYNVAAARQHRWARGDWQLLPWLLPARNAPAIAQMPLLGGWKIIDNLRRSLAPIAIVLALLIGWTLSPWAALGWTAFNVLALVLAHLLPPVLAFFRSPPRSRLGTRLPSLLADLGLGLGQAGFVIAVLVDQATGMADAILRTIYRLVVSRRSLLEWVTADQLSRSRELTPGGFYRRMASSPAVALVAAIIALAAGPATFVIALPFVIAWIIAPAVAAWSSRSRDIAALAALGADDADNLRRVARATWSYFETFVTAENNWLPPDNFQETEQRTAVARRTSPTNIGLYLIAAVSAEDFGWIGREELTSRVEATLATLQRMFRFRGHFYNWYDTADLRPLDPQYVSTVDSGNLAGHLIALANAFEEVGNADRVRRLNGILDALRLAREAAAAGSVPLDLDSVEARIATEMVVEGPLSADTLRDIAALILTHGGLRGADIQPLAADPAVTRWMKAALATTQSHLRDLGADDTAAARRSAIAGIARRIAMEMDFRFLLDRSRMLLSIGYVASENRRDSNCYDLLASEARLASLFAIAKRDVPTKHWFRLGRPTTLVEGRPALVSWSGSMFEYLMPSLVMRSAAGSLLESTSRLIVERQINYATRLGVPWGVSESAFNGRDAEFTYQYSNFGVPGLGLKRGLGANLVIAPYATALAAMVAPVAASHNFAALASAGAWGRFGFFEAIDYTLARVPTGEKGAVVQAYMAHHQGMTVVSIADVLLSGRMRRRFHAEPMIAATELLLEEGRPRVASLLQIRAEEVDAPADVRTATLAPARFYETAHTALPQVALLSNTRYAVMMTNGGAGYSTWNDFAITRWRPDPTLEDFGFGFYLRDRRGPRVWSAAYQPTAATPDSYSVSFADDRVKIVRQDRTIMTSFEVVVSAGHDAEVRRVSLTNMGGMDHEIEVTSYAELVLGRAADDAAHPAFSKMFVETEFVPEQNALLATRRRRSPDQPELWAAHFVVADAAVVGELQFETDRARFIGTGETLRQPAALDGRHLSGTTGTVLDPIFSLRRTVLVAPGATVTLSFWTVAGNSREAVMAAIDMNEDAPSFDRAATLAWTQAQVQLRHIGVNGAESTAFQRLAGAILFPDPALRAPEEVLAGGQFDIGALWALGISGDLPIVLARFETLGDHALARELARAHEYLKLKRLPFDLVLLNDRGASYAQDLQQVLDEIARTSALRAEVNPGTAGKVFVLRRDLLTRDSETALQVSARAIFTGRRGSLEAQLDRHTSGSRIVARTAEILRPVPGDLEPIGNLEFDNGIGGFAANGTEYVIRVEDDERPPAPWINVLANPTFGSLMAADGAGYSWIENSRDSQITPWSNDPVVNRSGETLYLRDEENGALWGPTAHPYRHPQGQYRATHGWGYSRYEHVAGDIASVLTAFVPLADSIKIQRLKLTNRSDRVRRISVAAYAEWVLGASRGQTANLLVSRITPGGALVARNARSDQNGNRRAFLALDRIPGSLTGNRASFIGRQGTLASPEALLGRGHLSGEDGGGLDACGAVMATLEIAPGGEAEIAIFLGSAATDAEVEELVARYRQADLGAELERITAHWRGVLCKITVTTPDRALDIMLNGWLLYQTLACRVWGRSGFYQASGAYGFRDQLQDCLALAHAAPDFARGHILRAAGRQFREGDVQHWWLPATGQGVRTRVSDDTAWLAYVTAAYVQATGDAAILDEEITFISGPELEPGEQDSFLTPETTAERATLYDHCARALDAGAATGIHGLPLIGAGDWNDGFNRVGIEGKGESVWLAWFQIATLRGFARLAEARGRNADAARWRSRADALAKACEHTAWDGAWYRRAYFDDGTPIGSSTSDECQIDSIAQSWAVISEAANPERARAAMAAARQRLVRNEDGMVLLFTPPFDKTVKDPGYIKGYPPGLRENGGQYTHAAIWMSVAEALLGDGDRAHVIFSMLNPIRHAQTPEAIARYKVEPYVVAADIYTAPGHVGRGGWTWYTGSAGWLYRAGMEFILGIRQDGSGFRVEPSIPAEWEGFRVTIRDGDTSHEIEVTRGQAGAQAPGDNGRVELGGTGGRRMIVIPAAASRPTEAREVDQERDEAPETVRP